MIQVEVALAERSYPILIGQGLLGACEPLLRLASGRMVAIVTDDQVGPLYAAGLEAALQGVAASRVTVTLPHGEAHKGWGTLERIFDAFIQSSRTKDGSGGTGLGLAISRRIMQAHGGTITAGLREGGGSVFRIWLPGRDTPATLVFD